ncbi:Lrp/AsnC family transcriptional regulator [Haladaptatus salinisoli]|uniref:Lrp/AsnC family transcriptional regulator n=1 Tax=Haladaptatus salinisoli TaxID=2884876 RepID=UPI0034A0E68F
MTMDSRDIEILKTVFELGDPSPRRIGEKIGIPKSTVHYRLSKLQEQGVLQNDLYEFDSKVAGFNITVITEVLAEYEPNYQQRVGEELSAIEGVSEVHFMMGDTDFIVVAHLPNSDHIQRLINEYEVIEGVERTSSKFVISTIKNEPNAIRNYDLKTLTEILR